MPQSTPATSPWLPARSSVVSEGILTPVRKATAGMPSPTAAKTYRILRTNEVDAYERPMARTAVATIGARAAPVGDDFQGTARKAAKLTIASAQVQEFNDLSDLLATLPAKSAMINHSPVITTTADSGRVSEENRNVRLRLFLYAASQEADCDYHLILGRDPNSAPHVYMTAEISGLPPQTSASFSRLSAARTSYKTFFADKLPVETYDFYDPCIPVEVEGSLFFDMTHANGQGPGPASLRKDIPTIWEIHPVTSIVFEP